jgi:hypothetical protein
MKKSFSHVILSAAKNLGDQHGTKMVAEILSAAKNDMSQMPASDSSLRSE